MKKYLISGLFIIAFVIYATYQYVNPAKPTTATTPITSDQTTTGNTTTQTSTSVGAYKDGTYTGKVTDAFYGNVQVKAIISGGKITDVKFIQYPNDRGESVDINTAATPRLTQEAIAAQSANVDVISGATQTSEAFVKSLQSALDQA